MNHLDPKLQSHFRTFDGPSVITKRNFSLLRGKTVHEYPTNLVKSGDEIGKRRWSIDAPVSPPPPSSPDSESLSPAQSTEHLAQNTEHRLSIVLGSSGPYDHSTNVWDWPLGEPKITNGDDTFEAIFYFYPYMPVELWADLMGNELMIHCKTETKRQWTGLRELFRCYTLPLNVNPRTAEFSIMDDRYLKVSVKKDLPLKLAIAYYGDLLDEEAFEDRSDSDHASSVTDDTV